MKKRTLLTLILITTSLTGCKTSKLTVTPPFQVVQATHTNWVGGQLDVRGTQVVIQLKENPDIEFTTLYFQQQKTTLETRIVDGSLFLTAHFNTSKKEDLILDANRVKELKNQLPSQVQMPVKVSDNQAVVVYVENNKEQYYIIDTVYKKQEAFYPKTQKPSSTNTKN